MSGHDRPGAGRHAEGISRIEAFADGVMAIAITLLVLNIASPPEAVTGAALRRSLVALEPHFFAYALSFAVIGRFWIVHHHLFRYIRRYDGRFLALNLLFLFTIAVLPFPTSLLGQHGDVPIAVVVYAVAVAAASLSASALWIYASTGHRLVAADLPDREIRLIRLRSVTPGVVFLLSIPLALVRVSLAFAVWVALVPLTRVVVRGIERRLRARETA